MKQHDELQANLLKIGRILRGRLEFKKRLDCIIVIDDSHAFISIDPEMKSLEIIVHHGSITAGKPNVQHYHSSK